MRPQLAHLVLDEIQFLLVQADLLTDGSRAVWHIKELLSLYNGHFFVETKDFQKMCAPAFAKAGARCICGYEI